MKKEFDVVIYQDEDGAYIVKCVDLPGRISDGNTKEEALENIKEAIELYLETLDEEKQKTITEFKSSKLIKVKV